MEFDYLKSLEIEEKINKIRWSQTANGALFLLSTNDKTIKFWKGQEKKIKKICDINTDSSTSLGNGSVASSSNSNSTNPCLTNGGLPDKVNNYLSNDYSFPPGGIPSLQLPAVIISSETSTVARCRRVYNHAHDYHISDGETFISADDLRINLWNLEVSNQSFNIVDVKPANMEVLTEVITSAEFYPTHCNTLAYSSLKGSIRLTDLRQSALCDSHTKLFEDTETPNSRKEEDICLFEFGQIVEGGFMTQAEFDEASMKALSLFEFGQRVAKEHGLILVDTKYEFGRSSDGSILLIDEIHTPDSSRYWLAGSYEERFQKGLEPENVDKEFLRLWFKENCNPYEDEVLPAAPAELVTELAWRYIFLYETITGSRIDILPTQSLIKSELSIF